MYFHQKTRTRTILYECLRQEYSTIASRRHPCSSQIHQHHIRKFIPKTMDKVMALILSMLMAFLNLALHVNAVPPGSALSSTYYDGLCPGGTKRFQTIASTIVAAKVIADPTLIPALARMCFHDGWVEGSDASVLLDFNSSFPDVEKNSPANNPSLRGYEVIDAVKSAVEAYCPGVISCADILQESVRVAFKTLFAGSLLYNIRYGRRDGSISLITEANQQLPPPTFNYSQLITSFASKGFNAHELMVLSGAHTFGVSHCSSFTSRLYNFYGNGTGTDPALDPTYAFALKVACPQTATVDGIVPIDYAKPIITLPSFDNQYYKNILAGKVLFISDNALQVGDLAEVNLYASNNNQFRNDFAQAIVKLSEVQVKLYPNGQIRANCRKRN
ncbi:hypothetical protein M758_4G143800 [Ceratodon purpureus]|nr:hypothetical protein M758_4G143800 [Ceratodon purpureus]